MYHRITTSPTVSIKTNELLGTNNNGNNLISVSNIAAKLQVGSSIIGVISEITKEGNAIFTTNNGDLFVISKNTQEVNKGDSITVLIKKHTGQDTRIQLTGHVTSVNERKVNTNLAHSMQLMLVGTQCEGVKTPYAHAKKADSSAVIFEKTNSLKSEKAIEINNFDRVEYHSKKSIDTETLFHKLKHGQPLPVQAKITYVNLSRMNENHESYKLLKNTKSGDNIELLYSRGNKSLSRETLLSGKVISEPGAKSQILQTEFGILEIENSSHKLPVGQKLGISIVSINNVALANSNRMLQDLVADLLLKYNSNAIELERLLSALDEYIKNMVVENNEQDIIPKQPNNHKEIVALEYEIAAAEHEIEHKKGVFELVNDNKEIMEDLFQELTNLKLIDIFSHENKANIWRKLDFNIKDEDEAAHSIFVKRTTESVRFIVNIDIETQLVGSLYIGDNNKISRFELSVRFKQYSMDSSMQNYISKIFNLSQDFSGIKGHLHFESSEEFAVPHD